MSDNVVIGEDAPMERGAFTPEAKAEANAAVAKAIAEAEGQDDPTADKVALQVSKDLAEKEEEAPKEEADLDKAAILKKIKMREKVQAERQKAREESDAILSQARQEQERARFMMQEVQRELAKFKELKTNPVKAVREAGWDPDEFIMQLAQAGSPEEKQRQQVSEQERKWKEYQAAQEAKLKELDDRFAAQARKEAEAHRSSVEGKFTELVTNEEKHPFAAALYKDNAKGLVQEGDRIAREYWEATGGRYDRNGNPVGGEHATLEDIAEYIDQKAEEYYQKLSSVKRAAKVSGTPAPKASKGKTISNAASSERRALTKDLANMTDEERIQEANAQVKAAIAASGGF